MKRLLLILACACGGSQTAVETPTPETTELQVDPLAIPPGAADNVQVELVSAGTAGEAEVLRLHPVEGHTIKLAMSMQMSMQMNIGGNQAPAVEVPATHMIFAIRVSHTNEMGLTRRELLLEEVRVDPGPNSEAVAAEVMPLEGMTGYEIVDSRGRSMVLQYEIPDGVSEATRQNIVRMQDVMQQVQPPFPEEPVAVGARWRVRSRVDNQVVMDQVQDFELVEREGERIVLRVLTTQSAEPQPMEVPQPGVTARLLSLRGEGTATTTIHLDRAAPAAEMEASIHLESEITAEAQTVPMTMMTRIRTQTAPQ